MASTSGQALGTAFQGLAEGTSQVGSELSNQSKKIVNKKFGEDYVKTFIEGEQPKTEQQTLQEPTQEAGTQNNVTEANTEQPLYPKIEDPPK